MVQVEAACQTMMYLLNDVALCTDLHMAPATLADGLKDAMSLLAASCLTAC